MKNSLICIILSAMPIVLTCQIPFQREKRDYQWIFGLSSETFPNGQNLHLDFLTHPPSTSSFPGVIGIDIANAGICDADGNLLFYTNGYVIMNRMHQLMENGAGLSPGLMTNDWLPYGQPLNQGAIVIAKPENDSVFYQFHERVEYLVNGPNQYGMVHITFPLYYSTIIFDSTSPDGRVGDKNEILTEEPVAYGKLTAVRHANGRDWWILVFKYFSHHYHRFLLAPEGITELFTDSIGLMIPSSVGQAVFSPDGYKYAKLNLYKVANDIFLDLYDVDRCQGIFTRSTHLIYRDTALFGGVAFSPNSRYLYVSSQRYLYQYDTWAEDIQASRLVIAQLPWDVPGTTYTNFGMMQLGPDGKIYISGYWVNTLHIIHNPNAHGAACELEINAIDWGYSIERSIPNHPYYGLGPWDGSPCDTLGIDHHPQAAFRHREQSGTVGFWDYSLFFPTQWLWDFGDGSAGSTEQNPTHTYAAPGEYVACLTVSNANATSTWCDTVRVEVVSSAGEAARERVELLVFPNPVPPGAPTTLVAEGISATLVAGTVRDALGRTVRRFTAQVVNGRIRQELDMRGLPAGVYFYELVSEGGVSFGSGKLVVRN